MAAKKQNAPREAARGSFGVLSTIAKLLPYQKLTAAHVFNLAFDLIAVALAVLFWVFGGGSPDYNLAVTIIVLAMTVFCFWYTAPPKPPRR